jgi:putative CocE/NonD family hydrolase
MESNNHPAQPRGYIGAGLDRLVAWMTGYPPERCSFTTQALRIPVSDGLSRIELAADLYQPLRPDGAKPLGTVLMRSPYGRSIPIALTSRPYAARGYQVLVVSSRGTFGSGGDFDPFRTEAQDGKAVVEWMRKQSWYTGRFATVGGSYLGYVQWALLVDPPKDMVAAVPGVSPHDFSRCIWETGAFNLDILRWADMTAKQERPFAILDLLGLFGTRKLDRALNGIPLAQTAQAHQGGKTPWLDTMLAKPNLSDPFYAPMQYGAALERSNIPILIITGWYDLFIEQSIEQYMRLKERGCIVNLTVGPWAHFKSGTSKEMSLHGFDWIEEHLGGSAVAKRSFAVQYFVTGVDEWRSDASFPPETYSCSFHLHGDGKLLEARPSATHTFSKFTFDPQQPTPTFGGNGLSLGSGLCDDTLLAKRSDVLVFDTAPLESDLEFCGRPTIELAHSSSSAFADIFVRVSEVDKNGKSHNITEGFKRLDPERGDSVDLKLALNHSAHRFLEGKRIRLLVAGGNFPQYARNHGVENLDNRGSEMRAVEHTVHHDAVHVSKVVFPVRSFRRR